MIGLRISVNGIVLFVIGQEDVSILTTTLVVSRGNDESGVNDYIHLNAGGLSQDTDRGHPEHFRWKTQDLSVGDAVAIEVVETDEVDAPVKRIGRDFVRCTKWIALTLQDQCRASY